MRDTERASKRQREKQAPLREPDVGLDPGTPGSCPGPKAGAKPLSHPGIPRLSNSFLAFHPSQVSTTGTYLQQSICLSNSRIFDGRVYLSSNTREIMSSYAFIQISFQAHCLWPDCLCIFHVPCLLPDQCPILFNYTFPLRFSVKEVCQNK